MVAVVNVVIRVVAVVSVVILGKWKSCGSSFEMGAFLYLVVAVVSVLIRVDMVVKVVIRVVAVVRVVILENEPSS